MKKNLLITLFLLILSFSITGCSNENKKSSVYKYGIQPPMDKLYWGMTVSEIEKALSIKDGVDGVSYKKEGSGTTIILPNQLNLFGYHVSARLEINDPPQQDWMPFKTESLYSIKLLFTDIKKQDLKDKLNDKFENQGRDWTSLKNNSCTTWESKDKVSDLSSNELDKLKSYWNTLSEHTDKFSPAKENSVDASINSVVLSINPAGTDASLTYNADTALIINKLCLSKNYN